MASTQQPAIRETLVHEIFPKLRKLGLLARANFMCCGGCASAELHERLKASPAKIGAVYFHKQDEERYRDGYDLFLNFGAREQAKQDEATTLIGWTIVGLAREAGLTVEWDGTPEQRIRLKAPERTPRYIRPLIG